MNDEEELIAAAARVLDAADRLIDGMKKEGMSRPEAMAFMLEAAHDEEERQVATAHFDLLWPEEI